MSGSCVLCRNLFRRAGGDENLPVFDFDPGAIPASEFVFRENMEDDRTEGMLAMFEPRSFLLPPFPLKRSVEGGGDIDSVCFNLAEDSSSSLATS